MKIYDELVADHEWQAVEVAADDTFRYLLVQMIFNVRLQLVRPGSWVAAYGWCFRDYTTALAAVIAWDPETQDEPLLWHKRVGGDSNVRQAPRREEDPDHNRARCVHGDYLDSQNCTRTNFCPEMQQRL